MGSLEESNFSLIKLVSLIILAGIAISFFFSRDLNVLSLGEEEALHLGVNIERTKRILFVLGSLIAGVAVSVSGIIGFVGLLVPHFMRLFVGPDHRILLPTSCLAGGIFLIASDTLARTIISPLELPVGVITGILGGTLFIYFLTKKTLRMGK
jgi:iron complex transport system permease protein